MKTVIIYQKPSGIIRVVETFDWVQSMSIRNILEQEGWDYDVEVIK